MWPETMAAALAMHRPFTPGIQSLKLELQALPVRQQMRLQVVSRSRNEPPAARDMELPFGKFRGSMMGTLPSRYLKWMSTNLSGDLAEWGGRAVEVLKDPVYRERLEWEQIEKHMDTRQSHAMLQQQLTGKRSSALAPALAFGWDLDDQLGWSKVNIALLGTTVGGRIPRLKKPEHQIPVPAAPEVPKEKRKVGGKKMLQEMHAAVRGRYNGLAGDAELVRAEPETGSSLREEMLRRRQMRRERVVSSKAPRLTAETAAAELDRLFPGREGLIQKIRDLS